ncbi:MAG: hypothetical protein QM744_16960 [Mesorhizobium sp.]
MRRCLIPMLVTLSLGASSHPGFSQESKCRRTDPVNTLEAMWDALGRCWTPPPGSGGLEVTVRFSLKRDGSLNGKPRITWLKRDGSESERESFVASVFQALETALPVPFTESMGNAAAGRPMTMRFSSANPNEKTL